MSSRRESPDPSRRRRAPRSGGLRPEPDVASASGGHLAPDVHNTAPLLDPIHEPGLPDPVPGWSSNDPIGAPPERRPAPSSSGRRRAAGRRRPTVRRVRRTLRHVDPFSILKLSLFFYAIFVIVWLVIVAFIYGFLDSSLDLFNRINDFAAAMSLNWEADLSLWYVERWALLFGILMALIGALVNTALAFLYNVAADLIGGVEMTYVERDA